MDWDSPPLNPNLMSSSANKPFRSGRRSSAGARSLFSAPSSVADAPGCGKRCLTRYPDPRRHRTYNVFRRLLPLQFDRGLTASSGRSVAGGTLRGAVARQCCNASHSQMIWLIYLSCFANAFSHCMATPSGCRVGTTFRPARGLSRWSLQLGPHLHSRVIKD
ncbi:hypothetical protein SASPL_123581 [Salvia splendens]|uniref:Uncharacterized protein n=1 Tax=Salvia splendens TaxID=180675 RepID=A0A8X8ZT51_SALSN|nr:hypothetical protein SASPL_123581 [Salvia splendens]